jgi:flagellar protein FlgJ
MNPVTPLAVDSRALDSLRNQAGQDPRKAVRQAAAQFESLFMRQLLKSMRDAMPKSGMWDSAGQSMVQDMYDAQLSQVMAGRPGGLADVIARQLTRHLGGDAVAGAAAAGTPAATAATSSAAAIPSATTTPAGGPAGLPAAKSQPAPTPLSNTVAAAAAAAAAFAARQAALEAAGQAAGRPAPAPSANAVQHGPFAMPGAVVRSAPPDTDRLDPQQADFVKRVWPHALLAERTTGVPAPFIVGQAALESGWGRHEIRRPDGTPSFNLFGIKAGGRWDGDRVSTTTTEYQGGVARKQVASFRAYGSYAEAFRDWAELMTRSPRYESVMRASGSVEGFASGMQRAGYATDPAYGRKLERTINHALALGRLVI